MLDKAASRKILGNVDQDRILALEQAAIRIPSSAFQEHQIADLFANYMSEIGLEVEMMEVVHPFDPSKKTRQPIGRLEGSGGGPSLMLNGHMDPGVEMPGWSVDPYGAKFEDGWIWGMGAHDDKGGVVAAICGVEAIVRSGVRLKGDVVITPVVAHKLGGAGTRALLKRGVRTDYCINMEHSNNTIANICVGVVMVHIKTRTPDLFFRFSQEAKAAYFNTIEQQAEIVRRIGPSLDPIPPGGWLTFKPHPDLPGFPMHTFDTLHKEHYYFKNHTGLTTREADLTFQLRTVPGQTIDSIRTDLVRLLEGIKKEKPAFNYELTIPAKGTEITWNQDPMECPKEHPLVVALAEGQGLGSGAEPYVGAHGRIGNVGDGNIIGALGIPTVQYGPGDIRIYKEWPTPDERVQLKDLTTAAKAVAHATARLCG